MYSINIRVTIDRRCSYFNPKLPKIATSSWSEKSNKWSKESHPQSYEINTLLQRKLEQLNTFCLRQVINQRPITFVGIKERYFSSSDDSSFNDFVDEYISKIRGLSLNTIKVYHTFKKHLNGFNPKLSFADLNEDFLLAFKDYLQIELGLKGAATKKYFDKLKVVCAEAVRKNYLEVNQNPFFYSKVKIRVEKPRRTYLEINEIKSIKELDLEDSPLERHRDFFLFQIYSGLYYSDLGRLTTKDLNSNGKGMYLIGQRSKNENPYIISLYKFPHARVIIDRYRTNDKLFPHLISEQKYNSALKKIADMAGILKNLTNKVGRHTYVQLWMSQSVERQFVSKMVGHTEENTTQEYYDISIHNIDSKIKDINFEALGI